MRVTLAQTRKFLASYRRVEIQAPTLTRAGVLMLLVPRNGELHFVLTKRTKDVEHHKGQISFPGGARDEADRDIVGTALRETEEEIGLPCDAVQVLGLLDDYETPSGFAVTPVVAYVRTLPKLTPNVHEVDTVLEIPVSLFLDEANERIELRQRQGRLFDVYFYRYGEHEVWGATAAIIRSFLRALRDAESRAG